MHDIFLTSESFGAFVLCIFQIYTTLIGYVYYLMASYMNPGYLTPEFVAEMRGDPSYTEDLDEYGNKTFCKKCNLNRPLRCHHCSVCNKCVLVYDHHCNIINNCIGHRNYKCFFSFLVIWLFNAILSLMLIIYQLFTVKNSGKLILAFIGFIAFYLITGFFILVQLIGQIPLLLNNTTHVEVMRNIQLQKIYNRNHMIFYNRFYAGNLAENISCRFGSNIILWFLPTPNFDTGYLFKQNPDYYPPYLIAHKSDQEFCEDPNAPFNRNFNRYNE